MLIADLLFKNNKACDFERLYDDWASWCLEDPYRCYFGKGVEGRVVDNAASIVKRSAEVVRTLNKDWEEISTCHNLEKIGTVAHDLGEMATIFAGFNHEFGTQQLEHFSHAEMKSKLLKVLCPMSLYEIFEMDWPGLISLFYEIVNLAG